ncbi:FCS-Like Zinc finger 8 isoform X1 [Capsicum annuum]|uniref:FCS-Like Zinc finger 8 isoform X1 n=1 Tax=Capsicum annuum TaxID=4072 RepID=UPI001FB0E397|nr:FCS-Like Zinc finger 8 isoform X1 [Capsicum annuum]XP_016553321.2 FCS-Like Zinc finger 8 isoform X1 [Capsicum annuum]
MADYSSIPSPTAENSRKLCSSFFGSPRLFTCFATKGFPDSESIMSPTSILDSKPFSAFRNPFWSDSNSNTPRSPKPESRVHFQKLDTKGVGLGLVDALIDEKSDSKELNSVSRMVVLGSQLKIQIPTFPPPFSSPTDSPPSPGDFGIKTRNSQLGSFSSPGFSPSPVKKSPFGSSNPNIIDTPNSPGAFSSLSAAEMELSEEYTCVISHGPNPRTTHIFDDCILESCCGVVKYSASRKENEPFPSPPMTYPSENFLSYCHTCKKNLGIGKDIYMYRIRLDGSLEHHVCRSISRYLNPMHSSGVFKNSLCTLYRP